MSSLLLEIISRAEILVTARAIPILPIAEGAKIAFGHGLSADASEERGSSSTRRRSQTEMK